MGNRSWMWIGPAVLLGIVALTPLWIITLPLAALVAVPGLILFAFVCAARAVGGAVKAAARRDPGEALRAARRLAFALAAFGFLEILAGISANVDIALAGAPPTAEEKRAGRERAYRGGWLAGLSAVAAFACQPRARPGKKPEADDDLA